MHMIRGNTVSQRMRAAGIFRYIATNGAGLLAGRIWSEMEAGLRDGHTEVRVHHSRLHDGTLIFHVDFQNAIHARKNYQDAALARERSAGKASAGASSYHGDLIAIRNLDDADDLFRMAREDYAVRARDFDRAVVFVQQQFFGAVQHGVGAEKFFQVIDRVRIHDFRLQVASSALPGHYRRVRR